LNILFKLLKGIDLQPDPELKFLKGTTLHNIGILQLWQGQYSDALESFTNAVEERRIYLPKNHPDIAVSMMRKGMAAFALERLDLSLISFESALSLMPEKSVARAKTLNCMGVAHYQKGDFVTALKEFTSALEIQRQWLDGPVRRESIVYDATVSLSNMGKLYMERSDYAMAYYVYEEALLLQTTLFRKDHDIVLASLTNLALAKSKNGQVQQALQILEGCLRSQNAKLGPESAASIETMGFMSQLHLRQEQYEQAWKCLATVKKWQKSHLPQHHPALRKTKETMKMIEKKLGKSSSLSGWI